MEQKQSDVLVLFGATGDLAYKKIFPALQAMVKSGRLEVPVIGVARESWTVEQLRARARDSIEQYGGGRAIALQLHERGLRVAQLFDFDGIHPRNALEVVVDGRAELGTPRPAQHEQPKLHGLHFPRRGFISARISCASQAASCG